jgi:nucleoside-diphosphate-sugar epimerase
MQSYGLYNPGNIIKAPFKESMIPPIEIFGGKIHYHAYAELLTEKSKGKSWTWCDVRPDAVVGFVPGGSAFNLTAHWGTYLALYAVVEGKGAKVYFPGTESGMKALYHDASAEMIGKVAIWASLHPEETGGQIFNVADRTEPSSQKERWPKIAKYFGLEGLGPAPSGLKILTPSDYMTKHRDVLLKKGVRISDVFYGAFLDSNMGSFENDRHFDMEKIRGVGFLDEVDPNESWFKAFDRYKEAGMFPI